VKTRRPPPARAASVTQLEIVVLAHEVVTQNETASVGD